MGVNSSKLNHRQKETLRVGNNILDICVEIVMLCNLYSIPVVVENPDTSYIWHCPNFASALVSGSAQFARIHQCAFKAAWKKTDSTRIR